MMSYDLGVRPAQGQIGLCKELSPVVLTQAVMNLYIPVPFCLRVAIRFLHLIMAV